MHGDDGGVEVGDVGQQIRWHATGARCQRNRSRIANQGLTNPDNLNIPAMRRIGMDGEAQNAVVGARATPPNAIPSMRG